MYTYAIRSPAHVKNPVVCIICMTKFYGLWKLQRKIYLFLFTFRFFNDFFLCLLTRRVETVDYVNFFQIKLDAEWSAVSSQTRMGSKGSDSVLTTFRECSRSVYFRLLLSTGLRRFLL